MYNDSTNRYNNNRLKEVLKPVGFCDHDLRRVLLEVVEVLPVQPRQDLRRVGQELAQAVDTRLREQRELFCQLAETLGLIKRRVIIGSHLGCWSFLVKLMPGGFST